MLLGLGTGSTARYFIDGVGRLVADGMRLRAVATSRASADQALGLGIDLRDSVDSLLDLTVDGADEVDPGLNLVKGLGGALLREKVVAANSIRMLVIATEDKLVEHLGRGPLPIEVMPLMWERTRSRLVELGLRPELRQQAGETFISDNGNLILDCRFDAPRDLEELAAELQSAPGVIGHGLFLGIATEALIAGEGGVRLLAPETRPGRPA